MTITIEIPPDIEEALREQWQDLPRAALEAVALEGYKQGALTLGQVGALLGMESRWNVRQYLVDRGVGIVLSDADLDDDLRGLTQMEPRTK